MNELEKALKKSLPLLLIAVLLINPLHAVAQTGKPTNTFTQEQVQLKTAMQRLWIDHVIWTRSFIVSFLEDINNQDAVLERLLKNQNDIGNAIKPFYGEKAGNQLATLLREHIVIAGNLIGAARQKNMADFKKFNEQWFRNADDIAEFLASLNPNWIENDFKNALYIHLQLLTDQVNAILNKEYEAEIVAFDKGTDHITLLADMLTNGIFRQFPEKFR